jgi:cytochrome c oxidase cbb3-type subunit 3
MDSQWLYGSGLTDIERTILAGSARGMPSFRDKLTRQQVWQLVAYVRSLSGHAPPSAAPVRDDHLSVRPPPSRTQPEPPSQQSID